MIDANNLTDAIQKRICNSILCLDKEKKCELCPISIIYQTIDLLDKDSQEEKRPKSDVVMNEKPTIMEFDGYNDHDGDFEKCPFCGESYNGYERIAMHLKNGEAFPCRKCGKSIAFRY